MYCKKCGAAVSGKFCCCCGTRVRTRLEDFRLEERRQRKSFVDFCTRYPDGVGINLELMHLGSACWDASNARYNRCRGFVHDDHVPSDVFASLETIRLHAEQLFVTLINF